jgi:hypothetical protein
VKFQYELTPKLARAALWEGSRRRFFAYVTIGAIGAAVSAWLWSTGQSAWPLILFAGCLPVTMALIAFMQVRAIEASAHAFAGKPIEVSIDAEGLRVVTSMNQSLHLWKSVLRIERGEVVWLIHLANGTVWYLPAAAIPAEARDELSKHV